MRYLENRYQSRKYLLALPLTAPVTVIMPHLFVYLVAIIRRSSTTAEVIKSTTARLENKNMLEVKKRPPLKDMACQKPSLPFGRGSLCVNQPCVENKKLQITPMRWKARALLAN